MCTYASMVRRRIGDRDPGTDEVGVPASIGRDQRCQATSPIHRRHEVVDVDDRRLELDDQKRPAIGVPAEYVDHPSFAVDRVRNLRRDGPRAGGSEAASDRLMHRGVPGVDEPIEIPAVPGDRDARVDTQRARHGAHVAQGRRIEITTLDLRDELPGHACSAREVLLAPTAPQSKGAEDRTDAKLVHEGESDEARLSCTREGGNPAAPERRARHGRHARHAPQRPAGSGTLRTSV